MDKRIPFALASSLAACLGLAACGNLMIAPITVPTSVALSATRTAHLNDRPLAYHVRIQDDRGNPLDGVTVTIMRHKYHATGDVDAAFESAGHGEVRVKDQCFDEITLDHDFVADRQFSFKSKGGVAAVSIAYTKPGYRRQLYVYNRGGNPKAGWLELPRSPDRWIDVGSYNDSVVTMAPEAAKP